MTSDPTSVPEPEGTKECERALWGSSDSPFCVVASLLRGRAESQKVWGRWLSLLVCGGPRPCTGGEVGTFGPRYLHSRALNQPPKDLIRVGTERLVDWWTAERSVKTIVSQSQEGQEDLDGICPGWEDEVGMGLGHRLMGRAGTGLGSWSRLQEILSGSVSLCPRPLGTHRPQMPGLPPGFCLKSLVP